MLLVLLTLLVFLVAGPLLTVALGGVALGSDWRTATHRSIGTAPDPALHPDAVVQVYAGRAFGWRGAVAVHTWLAAKPANATHYTRYEVIGWYARTGHSVVSVSDLHAPDAEWYGARPELIRDLRGPVAEAIIARLPEVVASYPYPDVYSAWPGPNSNTFIAHLGRAIPELGLVMPPHALGKDFLPLSGPVAPTPSNTGYQISLAGVLGIAAARGEGLELNVLGLVTGIDFQNPALKLPGVGRWPG